MQSPPRPVDVDRRIQTVSLLIIASVLAAVALYWLRPVLIPFVLALFLAYALMPLVDMLTERARLPRPLAVVASLVLGAAGLTAAGALVASSVRQLARNASAYQDRFVAMAQWASDWLARQGFVDGNDVIYDYVAGIPVGDTVALVANTLLDAVSNTFLVIVFALYILFGYRRGDGGGSALRTAIEAKIRRYIVTKFVVSAATGIFVGLTLALLGVDLALVFGVLAFLLNFIPSVGSIVATLLPLPVLLMSDMSPLAFSAALLVPLAIQTTIGNGIEPMLMGDVLELHPITVLLALILWGVIWGIPGMFLATPIVAVLKILLANLEITSPVAELMAGRVDPILRALEPTRSEPQS